MCFSRYAYNSSLGLALSLIPRIQAWEIASNDRFTAALVYPCRAKLVTNTNDFISLHVCGVMCLLIVSSQMVIEHDRKKKMIVLTYRVGFSIKSDDFGEYLCISM